MKLDLSPVGWLAIGLIAVIVVGINAALISLWRHRGKRETGFLAKAGKPLYNPWAREDARLQELSQRVAALRPSPDEEQGKPAPKD